MSRAKRSSKEPGKERRGGPGPPAKVSGRRKADRRNDQGIAPDNRGQDQPKDKERAQQAAGEQAQRDAARAQPPAPGQPARGE